MSAPIARRNYNVSDAALPQLIDSVVSSATRDITELAAYGWDTTKLDALMTKRNDFADYETDEEMSGKMVIATTAKNAKAEELRVKMREMRSRFINKFGEGSGPDRQLEITELSRMKDHELIRAAKRAKRVTTEFLAQLASEGVTAAMADAIGTLGTELDDLVDAQNLSIRNRDLAVEQRCALGNSAWADLVKLANSGKTCWENTSEAKYNDYVLTTQAKNIQVAEGNIAAGAIVNVSIATTSGTQIIEITNTGTENFAVYFAANPTDDKQTPSVDVAPGMPVTVTAADIGFVAGTKTRLNVINSSATTATSYRITAE